MPPSIRLVQLVQYTNVAASTVRDISNTANEPLFQVVAALTITILNTVQTVRSNRDQLIIMVEEIHDILCLIIHLYSEAESAGTLPTVVLSDIAKFTETLQQIYGFLKTQQGMGKIKQLVKQFDSAAQLKLCQEGLRCSLEKFKTSGAAINGIVQMQHDAQRQHEELLGLLAANPDLTNSDISSVTGTLSSLGHSTGSLSLLPPYPQIFHGRDVEIQEIVALLQQDSARIAVLGTGGMCKTSLAVAVLHHRDVEAKFANRFFIPCHSTATCNDLVSSIASHVGIAQGPDLARQLVRHLSQAPLPALLVLDNFETPWESMFSRPDVEKFLALLTDIHNLALIVTMRGAERPKGVKWTRPFLRPLAPLDDSSATEIFFAIVDDVDNQSRVPELLHLTGNLPLAINLIAHVATYEGCDATLTRWNIENTRILSDGYDKKSSLDISIMLSLSSARMSPQAHDLASILSMLPDGLSDADLIHSHLPIENILSAKATLIRISLAYVGRNERLCVLVPIREHIRATHPPSAALKIPLRQYFRDLVDLWKKFKLVTSSDTVSKISMNLGNLNSLMEDGLREDAPGILATVASILMLNDFYRTTSDSPSRLMPRVADIIMRFPKSQVYGSYFESRFLAARTIPIQNPEAEIELANLYFNHAPLLERAQWNNALAVYSAIQGKGIMESIQYREKAIAFTDGFTEPTHPRLHATAAMADALCSIGRFTAARALAQSAQQMAQFLGHILEQVQAVATEARCCLSIGDFKVAAQLCERGRGLLLDCGMQGTYLDLGLQNYAAEIHHVKTEFPEARTLYAQLANSGKTYFAALVLLNLATLDQEMGVESTLVRRNLEAAQLLFPTTTVSPEGELLTCEAVSAALTLRDGDTTTARSTFERVFAKLNMHAEGANFCLERLADLDTGMYDAQATLRWAGVYLGFAMRTKNNLSLVKALRCLGQIVAVEGDQATALGLFQVALDQFTAMDVHSWRADCMVRIAKILAGRGEILEGKELLRSARPLFDRSMQKDKVMAVDDQLALLDTV